MALKRVRMTFGNRNPFQPLEIGRKSLVGARKVSRNRWAGPDVPWDSRPRRLGGQPPGQGPQDRSWDSASRPLSCSQQSRAGGDREGGQALRVSPTLGCLSQQVCSEASTGQGCWRGPHATPG